jgi:NDP-sugar pyrophosphorylase family protein
MNDIQLVVPMAGLGSRFVEAGYKIPKPILPIGKLKMIEVVLRNLTSANVNKVIIVTKTEIAVGASLDALLAAYPLNVEIILIDETTDGPASTCMLAIEKLDLDKPLVIANSDQFLDTNMEVEYESWDGTNLGGVIWAMEDDSPKWSYVRTDLQGLALEVKEKKVISNLATCGVYGYSKARFFVDSYNEMVAAKDLTNNEFYVAPTYNYLIAKGEKIKVRDLGPAGKVMHGLGVPEDYELFLKSEVSLQFNIL